MVSKHKMKFLSTRMHGVLDYVMVAALLALPRMLGWSERVTMLLTVLAVGALVFTLLTRFELGLIKVLPMKVHLALDVLSGAALIGAALILADEPNAVRAMLAILGLFEILAVMITRTEPLIASAGHSAEAQAHR